jgi:hypothetical protein
MSFIDSFANITIVFVSVLPLLLLLLVVVVVLVVELLRLSDIFQFPISLKGLDKPVILHFFPFQLLENGLSWC